MTDEVPDDVAGQRLMLELEFLLMALAEDALSLLVGGLYILIGVVFTDCHKAYALWQCVNHSVQVSLDVVHLYFSNSGLSSVCLPYSKTSISLVSLTLAMT